MIISKAQVLSWYERLTFIKNEVQAELDTTVPGTDGREASLQDLNGSLQESRAKIEAFAKAAGIQLFPGMPKK